LRGRRSGGAEAPPLPAAASDVTEREKAVREAEAAIAKKYAKRYAEKLADAKRAIATKYQAREAALRRRSERVAPARLAGREGLLPFERGGDVTLRRYPFPYRAALAVSNDTDGMDWAGFEDWHAFVSGTGSTPYGDGLGLEVGDSFWLWSDRGAFALRHAPPWENANGASPEARRIAELVSAGWLDTLHSFGDWRPEYQLSKSDIGQAFEILDKLGARPAVYVNHGDGVRLHNIGGPWSTYQSGDDPASDSYNLAGLLDRGFRFFWTDVMAEKERFGRDLKLELHRLPSGELEKWTSVARYASKEPSCAAFPGLNSARAEEIAWLLSTRELLPAIGRDGRSFFGFARYRGLEPPSGATFASQVSTTNLDALQRAEGVAVVYQHFGVWRALGRPRDSSSRIEGPARSLDDNAVWAFRDLHARQAEGRLFITTTARLLNFLWTRDNLKYSTARDRGSLEIVVDGIHCPVYGRQEVLANSLQGIAFLVDGDLDRVTVRLGNGEELSCARERDPLHPGKQAIHLPWRRLEFPARASRPPRSLTAQRIGQAPPAQERPIAFRPLASPLAAIYAEIAEEVAEIASPAGELKEDLRKIATAWAAPPIPPLFESARAYVEKMHAHPFEAYHSRLRRLTAGGAVALDAGSGTSTWSFPLADLFGRVVAVDRSRDRVDMARWLVDFSGNRRIEVTYGDVTNLDQPPASVDFVFCYGVIITVVSLRATLREFRRVTRPGGVIYVCLNGIGWSYHLRDERGLTNPKNEEQGRQGLYNTYCRRDQPMVSERFSKLRVLAAAESAAKRLAAAINISPTELEGFFVGAAHAASIADLRFPAGSAQPVTADSLAAFLDRLLAAAELAEMPLAGTLAAIKRECGNQYAKQFGRDLLDLLVGRRETFSHANAGRGYAPAEVEEACGEVGLVDFRWAGEGELVGFAGEDVVAPKFFQSQYGGELGVWEFMARRP
jgi:SAM-dependent methyltransferase